MLPTFTNRISHKILYSSLLSKIQFASFPVPQSSHFENGNGEWQSPHKCWLFGNRWDLLHMVLWDLMNHYVSSEYYIIYYIYHGAKLALHWWWRALFADSTNHGIPVFWGWSPGILASQSNLCWFSCQRPASEETPPPPHCTYGDRMDSILVLSSPSTRNKEEFAKNTNKNEEKSTRFK